MPNTYTTGIDFVIQIDTGTGGTPTWTTIAGQQSGTLNRTMKAIDVTNKDSGGWTENIAGLKDWSIDFDGLLVESDTAFAALEDAFNNNTVLSVQLQTAAGNKYAGSALLTSFPLDAPYDKEATYKGTLTGTGALTKTPTA